MRENSTPLKPEDFEIYILSPEEHPEVDLGHAIEAFQEARATHLPHFVLNMTP